MKYKIRPWRIGSRQYKQIFRKNYTCFRLGVACLKGEEKAHDKNIYLAGMSLKNGEWL